MVVFRSVVGIVRIGPYAVCNLKTSFDKGYVTVCTSGCGCMYFIDRESTRTYIHVNLRKSGVFHVHKLLTGQGHWSLVMVECYRRGGQCARGKYLEIIFPISPSAWRGTHGILCHIPRACAQWWKVITSLYIVCCKHIYISQVSEILKTNIVIHYAARHTPPRSVTPCLTVCH